MLTIGGYRLNIDGDVADIIVHASPCEVTWETSLRVSISEEEGRTEISIVVDDLGDAVTVDLRKIDRREMEVPDGVFASIAKVRAIELAEADRRVCCCTFPNGRRVCVRNGRIRCGEDWIPSDGE
jgi:hypothetical protein